MRFFSFLCVLSLVLAVSCRERNTTKVCTGKCQMENLHSIGMNKVMPLKEVEWDYCLTMKECPQTLKTVNGGVERCIRGEVNVHGEGLHQGSYDCNRVDLMSYYSGAALGSSDRTSDIWGVTINNRELAIVGHADGSSVVDLTDALNPLILGFLPTFDCGEVEPFVCTKNRLWRDIKIYDNRAYIVSENYGHGMQVLNLENLLENGPTPFPQSDSVPILTPDYHYTDFGKAHNIALNVNTGFAYVVGSQKCNGGLYIVDVSEEVPVYAGCYADDGYTHDTQCVSYAAPYPDEKYYGREICFAYNEDSLTIVDVTDKDNIALVSRTEYKGCQYTHQGWMTEDGLYLLMDDELDEVQGTTYVTNTSFSEFGARTRTLVWSVRDLENPAWETSFFSPKTVIDHNQYIFNGLAFQSNYCGGLRVLDASNPLQMTEYGYFDVAPYCDGPVFQGTWSNFPYYPNHPNNENGRFQIVAVASIERGLFIVRVQLGARP